MCGILFIASAAGDLPEASGSASDCSDASCHLAPFLQGLASRGPDKTGTKTIYIGGDGDGDGKDSPLRLTFAGSILQLRGHEPVSPPLVDPTSGNILLWNGEIFNENKEKEQKIFNIPPGGNDAETLLHTLTATSDIPAIFSSIRGPWACVFWHAETETLWYGRDVLGRRSLLAKWPLAPPQNNTTVNGGGAGGNTIINGLEDRISLHSSLILTSVSPLDNIPQNEGENEPGKGFTEVKPGLYKIQFSNCRHPLKIDDDSHSTGVHGNDAGSIEVQNGAIYDNIANLGNYLARFKPDNGLITAVDWTSQDILAIKSFHRPENFIKPDEENEEEENDETKKEDGKDIVGVKEEGEEEEGKGSILTAAAAATNAAAVEGVLNALRDAVRVRCHCIDTLSERSFPSSSLSPSKRILDTTEKSQPELEVEKLSSFEKKYIKPAELMILFSGGVDSTLLAALAHEYMPPDEPIDLVSICFAGGTSPDREAALSAFEELKKIAPHRPWRLLGADKILEDVENARDRLLKLLYPADTVMDLNIGAALWLAAAGEGKILKLGGDDGDGCRNGRENNLEIFHLGEVGMMYRSAARCVFLGHGADELFGGYGRHRTRFRNAGWQGLSDELALDVKRLWVRNLGRDDRLVADRGREARHPFLDEGVVLQALQYWPLSSLTDLRLTLGVGDKRVLREILRELGLPEAAGRVKRAIQFGTRLAKVTNVAQFGGTRQANAKSAGSVRLADVPRALSS